MSLLSPFIAVARAVRAFFRADLRLRRGQRGLEVVLDDSPAEVAPRGKRGATAAAAQQKVQREFGAMQRSLGALLDELPENRTTLRHLAFIEHALAKKGHRALHKIPYDILQRALAQFEAVVTNWSDEGLAALRSKMAVTLIEREAEAADPQARDNPPGTAATTSILDSVELAHPVELPDDDAEAAAAALRAAYGDVMLPDLQLVPMESAGVADVEVQGELDSPSAKAIAKAVRRGEDSPARTPQAAELQS